MNPAQNSDLRWAREVLENGFEQRIKKYLTVERVRERISEKETLGDSLYEAMLRDGAGDKHYVSMLTYWSIGQGVAVLLRHWIEELIKELILHPRNERSFGKPISYVYTLKELKRGLYVPNPDAIAVSGESETEHTQSKSWNVGVRSALISTADKLADAVVQAYEQRPQAFPIAAPKSRYDPLARILDDLRQRFPLSRAIVQREQITQEALDASTDTYRRERLICNLIVIEKPPGRVMAFRFAIPALGALRRLRDEKRNLLLLYGWLRQEKPFRVTDNAVDVYWTHLIPREVAPAQVFFFDEPETMGCERFWEYIGVPFNVVRHSLNAAGLMLRRHIRKAVREAGFDSVGRQLAARSKQRGLFGF